MFGYLKKFLNYKDKAIEFFNEAIKKLGDEIFVLLLLHNHSNNSNSTNGKQLKAKISIYNGIQNILQMNIKELEQSKKDNRSVFMRSSDIENIFTEREIKEEASKLKSNGLGTIFTIKEKCSRKWTAAPIVLLGLAQFALGSFLVFGPFTTVIGMSSIAEGLSDIIYGVVGGITGSISWKEYGIQKAIGVAVTIATAGILQGLNFSNFQQAFQLDFKESFLAAVRAGPGSILKRSFRALVGEEFKTILIKTGEEVVVKPQVWRAPLTFLLRRFYQEKISKKPEYGYFDAVRESFEDRIKKEQEYLENKYKELLRNVDNDEIAPTEFVSAEEELREEIMNNIPTQNQFNSLIETISDLDAVSEEPIDLDEKLRVISDELYPEIRDNIQNGQDNCKSKLKNKSKITENIYIIKFFQF